MTRRRHDVVVVGDGPAGAALAWNLQRAGVDVVLVGDDAPWTATYGCWADDLERIDWLREALGGEDPWTTRLEGITVRLHRERHLDRPYGVVDTATLRRALRSGLASMRGRVEAVEGEGPFVVAVVTADSHGAPTPTGRVELDAGLVVDATGWPGLRLRSADVVDETPRQTAIGVVLPEAPVGALGAATLMDFGDTGPCDVGEGERPTPSFAYALPVEDGWLVEETVLAAWPPVDPDRLWPRLAARLERDPASLRAAAVRVERVDIVMGGPLPARTEPILRFGAAAAMVHPATGYSIASSLDAADRVAAAVIDDLAAGGRGPMRPERSWEAVWPRAARRSRALHDFGLGVVTGLGVADIRSFFETFFELDTEEWRDYLRIDTGPRRLAGVMTKMFVAAPWSLRRRLVATNPLVLARLLRP